jgi:DnaJ like chaperone protein
MGHVAKADGRVTEREIAAARHVMQSLRLDSAQVQGAIALFSEGKQPDFDLAGEMAALRASCRSQPEILRMFLEIQMRFALAGSDMTT